MPTFTLDQLADGSGWAVALVLAIAIIGLLLRGDIVPKGTAEAQRARADATDKVMAELVPGLREILTALRVMGTQQDFLVDFVKDTLRDRRRDSGRD